MGERALYCYAWDLADKGVDAAVEEFKALGVNTATLAASYHAGKFLRPHGESGRVCFPQDGTAYFRTDPSHYGEIKPVENDILKNEDVLATLCGRQDIKVNAWLVLMHNSRLGAAYPHASVENAFGDRYVYSLCPASPAAREYAVALCTDVMQSYAVGTIALETPGFLPYVHGYHHEFALVRQNVWLNNLLGLCFCEHCLAGSQSAGIDAEALRHRVKASVDGYLVSDLDHPDDMAAAFWLADVVQDADLGAYLRWRCATVTTLVGDIRAAVRDDVAVGVIPSVARPTGGAWYEGTDLNALGRFADRIDVCFYEPSVARVKSDYLDVARRLEGNSTIGGILRPSYPDHQSGDAVAGAVRALTAAGVEDIAFYNYGHLRQASLDWIAQALAVESSS